MVVMITMEWTIEDDVSGGVGMGGGGQGIGTNSPKKTTPLNLLTNSPLCTLS